MKSWSTLEPDLIFFKSLKRTYSKRKALYIIIKLNLICFTLQIHVYSNENVSFVLNCSYIFRKHSPLKIKTYIFSFHNNNQASAHFFFFITTLWKCKYYRKKRLTHASCKKTCIKQYKNNTCILHSKMTEIYYTYMLNQNLFNFLISLFLLKKKFEKHTAILL